MEQAISRTSRRSGWSDHENTLLWETADEAQQQGLPLKTVFEQIAEQTGRRPNSIRNYYYAQVRQREDGQEHSARFVPFTQSEVDWLMEQVLIARAAGQSVRSCLQKLSGGDHSLMLRYQNKYRAVIKSRPDYVRTLVDKLNHQGITCDAPQVNHRNRADLGASCAQLVDEAQRSGDQELARACDVLSKYLRDRHKPEGNPELMQAAIDLIDPIKDFIARPNAERLRELENFCGTMSGLIGQLESCLPDGRDVMEE